MYAIVDIDGKQYKVQKNDMLLVNRLKADTGKAVDFSDVKLIDDNGKVTIGEPNVSGATVKAKVLEHLRGDKVTVFKKKRRKGYKTTRGHRQDLSRIEIQQINKTGGSTTAKSTAAKSEAKTKAATTKADEKKTESAPAATETGKATKTKTATSASKPAEKKTSSKTTSKPAGKSEESTKTSKTASGTAEKKSATGSKESKDKKDNKTDPKK